MKSVAIIACFGAAEAALRTARTVGLEAEAKEAEEVVAKTELELQAEFMAIELKKYREEHRSKFFENTAVTVSTGTVKERPIMEPRGEIVMPIVFDGVMVGYPPTGIPVEYIGTEMFGKNRRAELLAADPHREGHGPQVLAGIGSEPFYRYMGWDEHGKNMINALFDPRVMPAEAPHNWFTSPQDVTRLPYNNFMANIFKDEEFRYLWTQYSDMKTPAGYTFAEGAKTGIDNPGHPNIIACGFMFTDEHAPTVWQEFTDEMMFRRHKWHPERDYFHSSNLAGEVPSLRVDPTVNDALMQGMFIKTSRIRTGRSIKGFALPPSIKFQERRALEKVIINALATLGETNYAAGFERTLEGLGMSGQTLDLSGTYFPEFMSQSMSEFTTEDHPNIREEHFEQGMDIETNRRLLASGNAFQHPDSTLLLSTGCARNWPDARGVWENADSNLFVWVSEEDHMRIVSMERGGNFQKVWMRFITGLIEIEEAMRATGYEYILSERYGYILSCPSNTGAGIRAGSHIRLRYLPKWADGKLGIQEIGAAAYEGAGGKKFKGFCEEHRLQGRGQGGVDDEDGGDIVDLSNVDRIGYSEAQLVTFAIKGMASFVRLEMRLHFYKEIEKFETAVASGDRETAARAYNKMKNYNIKDTDKDGNVVQTGEWAGSYDRDLLDPNFNYVQEFCTNPKANNPVIAEYVAAARAEGDEGKYDEALAALKAVQPLLLEQFNALKEAGLAESHNDIAAFKAEQKELSDAKRLQSKL
jgi:creatine kinase